MLSLLNQLHEWDDDEQGELASDIVRYLEHGSLQDIRG
jgi:hypothetical protein